MDYGQEEAIAVQGTDPRVYNTTVKAFHHDESGKLTGVTAVNLRWDTGEDGRRVMTELDSYEMDCDMVLIAAGFLGCQDYIADAFGVERTPRTVVATAPGAVSYTHLDVYKRQGLRRRHVFLPPGGAAPQPGQKDV